MPRYLLCASLCLIASGRNPVLAANTLREALRGNNIPVAGRPAADLDRKITSYATYDAIDEFVIAYYPDDGSGLLGETLYVDLYRKPQSGWITRRFERNSEDGDRPTLFGGSVIGIAKAGDYFLINTHVNPSASQTLVLGRDLEYHDTFFGWAVSIFPDGLVVYQHSEVHFAPTHYVEMSVYDARTKKHRQIYPKKPYGPVRQRHVGQVRAAYQKRGEEWFKKNNHHMNPELFDNFLQGDVAADGAVHSLAFVIAFDNTDTWDYAEKLKLLNFGALIHSMEEFRTLAPVPEGIFGVFGQGLESLAREKQQDVFLGLFKTDSETQEMIRRALASAVQPTNNWRARLLNLDARWGRPEVWKKVEATLATPPETTEVICIFRHLDQEQKWAYREWLLSDFQKKFGDQPLPEYLELEKLNKIFAD